MANVLQKTVVVWDGTKYHPFSAGTNENDIPRELRAKITNPAAFQKPSAAAVDGIVNDDPERRIEKLDDMKNAELDALGLRQDPPIDLSSVRKKADKVEVLRSAGVGNE